ncbi:Spindle assembly checkpoint kinase [Tritrichomonas foetus]|uniref:Spindle assembly checkpoint kinase n=1 Tax=Tritrichomonas foetus TaxID=1144522 RepID=A0A1J4KS21_9EUKA|nr:Spindle assembly checkpoint kinase [Tritrichomonas foetus]|eukprot:OHT12620.1 Spindle assembly checkpoint kinase [Tritrichomonas foetus]
MNRKSYQIMILSEGVSMDEQIERIKEVLSNRGYQLLSTIGSGSYATAFTIKSLRYDTVFVAKVIYNKEKDASTLNEAYQAEMLTLLSLNHPFVIHLYEYFTDNNMLYIILEYCERGSLMNMIRKNGPINPINLKEFCHQILKGLQYIHSQNIAHRDIKPDNIFVTYKNTVKIADFGFSQYVETGQKIDDCRGSIAYCSPEILKKAVFDPFKADIWALGVTFYVMATGKAPFTGNTPNALRHSIEMGIFLMPSNIDESFADMIKKMIVIDPARRLTPNQLLEHDYFKSEKRGPLSYGFVLADVAILGKSSKVNSTQTCVKNGLMKYPTRLTTRSRRSTNFTFPSVFKD